MQFGSFDSICASAALVVCPLLGDNGGMEPQCYSRNVMLGSYVLFQPGEFGQRSAPVSRTNNITPVYSAVAFVHLLAMCMTIIMILHIRSKYTAVVRPRFPAPTLLDSFHLVSTPIYASARNVLKSLNFIRRAGKKSSHSSIYILSLNFLLSSSIPRLYLPRTTRIQCVSRFGLSRAQRLTNPTYWSQWIAALYTGLVAATYCCLLINGFIGFQFAEDGTPLSIWVCV